VATRKKSENFSLCKNSLDPSEIDGRIFFALCGLWSISHLIIAANGEFHEIFPNLAHTDKPERRGE
jgi:hypothetical protein